jgi:hypothetical protein
MLWFETRAKRLSRVKQATANYPFYDRPYKRKPTRLSEAEENFDYFMRVRLERLAFFQHWLKTNFSVIASFDSDGASSVDRWVNRYGDALLGDLDRDQFWFPYYSKSWTQDNPGYSVIFDLGIFIGEFVIDKRPWCRWALMQETPDKPWIKRSIAKLQPALFFQRNADAMDAMQVAWGALYKERAGTRMIWAGKGKLVGWIKLFMYTARVAYESPFASYSLKDTDRESFDRMPMIEI